MFYDGIESESDTLSVFRLAMMFLLSYGFADGLKIDGIVLQGLQYGVLFSIATRRFTLTCNDIHRLVEQ